MQKITPFLWFDDQAEQAIDFYTSTFNNSKIGDISRYESERPGDNGEVMTGTFRIEGQEFMVLNGGPQFNFTPATSFFVHCDTADEVDRLWQKLSEGGSVLVPLGEYPFSDKFGWLQDRFGLSWQINLGSRKQKITPFLMFVGEQHGRAEEAINLYTSLFKNASIDKIDRFAAGEEGPEGAVRQAVFNLEGQEFMAIDSGLEHKFTFTEAVSYFVTCETQEEVDYFWNNLTRGGEESMCGWLKDKFGVSWQIIPRALGELLNDPDPVKAKNVADAMLQMQKIDIAGLRQAYEQG